MISTNRLKNEDIFHSTIFTLLIHQVSSAAARSVGIGKKQRISGIRSVPKIQISPRQEELEDLSADNSPHRDRMVREMHVSKYRVRSTSRPPAPPIRMPDKKSNASLKDTGRYVPGGGRYDTEERRDLPQGILLSNRASVAVDYSVPSNLSTNSYDPIMGRGQGDGDKDDLYGQAYTRSDFDADTSQSNSCPLGKIVSPVRSEKVDKGGEEMKIRGKEGELVEDEEREYADGVRVRTRIAKSSDINDQKSLEAYNSMSTEGARNGPGGIVWIDGAPYSDLISNTTSRQRGSDALIFAL